MSFERQSMNMKDSKARFSHAHRIVCRDCAVALVQPLCSIPSALPDMLAVAHIADSPEEESTDFREMQLMIEILPALLYQHVPEFLEL